MTSEEAIAAMLNMYAGVALAATAAQVDAQRAASEREHAEFRRLQDEYQKRVDQFCGVIEGEFTVVEETPALEHKP